MTSQLKIALGQHSDKGRRDINQDFHGVYIPKEPQLSSKGIALEKHFFDSVHYYPVADNTSGR